MKYIYKRINVDIAIGFQEGDTHYFASYFYNKIYWIHCDFAYPHSFHKYYDFFYKKNTIVKIICVSEYTAASFNSYIHNGNNADYLLNTINIDNIIEQSNKNITDIDDTNFSIISIGRFVALKQFHLIPRIVNAINLMNPQTDFKWYIIASGSEDMKLTINEINKYNLEKQIIILGERNNPYPYYKNADLTVCLSRSESFSYILFESMILGTPVISNNFPVAQQLIDNKYGIVCHIDLIAYEIFNLLNNKKKYLKLKNNLKYFTYPNKEILLKFEKIISGIL
ncbi:MAG: glycosyltransferase [Clostridia bacterium]|nr:glycosyltransferase [Clostridia bacterium]